MPPSWSPTHPSPRPTPTSLRAFLAELGPAIGNLHDHIEASFFSPVGPATSSRAEMARGRVATGAAITVRTRVPRWTTSGAGKIGAVAEDRVYRVTHTTTYEYAAPVEQSYNEAHLRPRRHGPPDVHRAQPRDRPRAEHSVRVGRPVRQQRGDLRRPRRVRPHGGHRRRARCGCRRRPASRRGRRGSRSGPCSRSTGSPRPATPGGAERRRASIPTSNALADYAQASFHPGRPLVEAVLDLTGRIYREFHYEPGFTSISTPLLEVLEQRRGVCQDFAHLMIGCIRSLGLAARYVSGYIETLPPPGQERLVGADASHAWASVYLPGWGWVDVDPTNDQFVAESYITTAWGRDYWDVSPLRGSVEGGGGSHRLDVAVDVTRVVTATADV